MIVMSLIIYLSCSTYLVKKYYVLGGRWYKYLE